MSLLLTLRSDGSYTPPPTPPQYVAESHADYTAATINTAQNIVLPTGTQQGDLLIIWLSHGTTGATVAFTGTGWNLVGNPMGGSDQYTSVWWKIAGASEPQPSFSCSDLRAAYTVAAYRGSSVSIDSAFQFTDSPIGTTHAVQTMTTTQDAWMISYVSLDGSATPVQPQFTAPTGWTKRVEWINNTTDNYLQAFADYVPAAAGSQSGHAWTSAYADRTVNVVSVSFRLSAQPQIFSGSASLSGDGTLSGVSPLVTTSGASGLSGDGTLSLSGSSSQAGSGSISLTGSGTLSGTGTPRPVGSTAFAGSGTLSLSGALGTNAVLVRRMVGRGTVRTWTTNVTSVRLKVGTDAAVTTGVTYTSAVTPDAGGVTTHDTSSYAAGKYYYRVAMTSGGTEIESTQVGRFKTAPSGVASFSFCAASCTDAVDSDAMAAIAARDDDFFVHLGDLYYNDALSNAIGNFRSEFTAKADVANHAAVFSTTPTIAIPSDHDLMGNNLNAGLDATAAANYNTVHREFFPDPLLNPGTSGVQRTFTWGRVRFIILDCRSFASSPAATDNATKTMLGATQKQWLKDTITAATEPLIVLAGDSPWTGAAVAGDDAWVGFNTERQELATFYSASGKKIVYMAGDQHALSADDGTNSPGSIPVFQCSPLNNTSSHKGTPYSSGTPYPTTTGVAVQQYARFVVTDTGSQISIAYTGYSSDNTARVTQTVTTPVAFSGSASLAGAGSLSFVGALGVATTLGLGGSGTIAAVASAPKVINAAALSGAGTLAAVANSPLAQQTLGFSGAGTLVASASAVSVTQTLGLSGAGTLTSTAITAFATSVALTGSGTLAFTAIVAYTGIASLNGSGTLSGVGKAAVPGAIALSGSGTLSSVVIPGATASLSLSGSGSLAGTGVATSGGSGAVALSGSGTLGTTTGTVSTSGSLTLSGAGTLTSAATVQFARSMSLSGDGTISSASLAAASGSTNLSGAGTLAGAGTPLVTRTVPLSGVGTLSSTGTFFVLSQIGLSGSGTLTSVGQIAVGFSMALSGSGTLSLLSVGAYSGSAALSGSGSLTATGAGSYVQTLGLSGSGTLSRASTVSASGALGLSGSGTLSSSQFISASLGLAGVGSLAAAGASPAVLSSASLNGSGSLSSSFMVSILRALALSGSGTLSSASTFGVQTTLGLTGSGSLSSTRAITTSGSSALSGDGTLGILGGSGSVGALSLSGQGTLVGAGQAGVAQSLSASGTGTLSVAGVATPRVSLALSGTGTLAASLVRVFAQSALSLSGAGALTGAGAPRYIVTVSLAGTGTLVTIGNLVVIRTLEFTGSGILTGEFVAQTTLYDITILSARLRTGFPPGSLRARRFNGTTRTVYDGLLRR